VQWASDEQQAMGGMPGLACAWVIHAFHILKPFLPFFQQMCIAACTNVNATTHACPHAMKF
jgi:hypothetical protein